MHSVHKVGQPIGNGWIAVKNSDKKRLPLFGWNPVETLYRS